VADFVSGTAEPKRTGGPLPAGEGHAAFWERLGAALPAEERAALDSVIAAKLAGAQGHGVAPARLLAHWAGHLQGAGDLLGQIDRTHLEDLALALACAEGSPTALERLQSHLLPQALNAVRRIDPSPSFLDELRQHLLERLLLPRDGQPPRIAEFAAQSSLLHWLRAVALRQALNHRRDARRIPEELAGETLVEIAAPLRDPQLELLKQRHGPAFSQALREGLSALEARERSLLRLHYVDGLSLAQIGAVYQVNKSTISRWLNAAREALLVRLGGALEDRLGVAPSELESLMRALRSQVELDLSSLLRSRVE
jgi:RNA polymerase sigma-70 factor (ECF subfamily)